jgi:hypothetical protein
MACSEIIFTLFSLLSSVQINLSVFHSGDSLLTVGLSSFPFVREPFLVTQILGRKENIPPTKLFSVKFLDYLFVFMSTVNLCKVIFYISSLCFLDFGQIFVNLLAVSYKFYINIKYCRPIHLNLAA